MTSTGIRVLVLTSLFPQSPGEKQGNFVLDQVRALAAQGADVTVLIAKPWVPAPPRGVVNANKRPVDPAAYSGEQFRVVNASFFSLPRFRLGTFAAQFIVRLVADIRRIQQEYGIDVIHAHGFVLGHAAVAAAEKLRVPAVITVHGIETAERFDNSAAKRKQIGRMLEKSDRIVLVGSPLIEYVRRYTPKVERCVVVGNGFTTYPGLEASTRVPRQKPVRVIAVSNYELSKGFELLLEGIGALEPEVRNQVETVLVGDGEEFSRLLSRAKELGLGDQVHYLGPLLHREAMAEVLASDLFCLPSWKEAFGIMYAEAMA
ncbi:MAG: glycosyltransferase [Acidobacteriaceae bacterium]